MEYWRNVTTLNSRELLIDALKKLGGKCGDVLRDARFNDSNGRTLLNQVVDKASYTQFYSVRGLEGDMLMTQAISSAMLPVPMNPELTVSQYAAIEAANARASGYQNDAFNINGRIFLQPTFSDIQVLGTFIPRSAESQGTILIHEMLHFVIGGAHLDWAARFGIAIPAGATDDVANLAFNNWFRGGCN